MREELLAIIEKNSRIDLKELAVILGVEEIDVVNEIAALVRSVYLISGAYDLMVILEGKTLREVSNFVSDKLSTLDSVLSTATHFILKKYKDHGTAFAVKKEDEREMITP